MADRVTEVTGAMILAAENANKKFGDKIGPDGQHVLSGDELGTGILDLAEEAEINRENSYKDPLTGLLNRRGAVEEYKRSMHIRERVGLIEGNTLVALDLIGLKKLNNELTPEGADQVLKNAADSLTNGLRQTDLVIRWGGDEILLVLFGTSKEGALKVIDEINNNLPEHVHYNIGYREIGNVTDAEQEMNDIMKKMDEIKKIGGVDKDGRAVGNGVIADVDSLKQNV